MGRRRNQTTTETLAVGIKGDRHSLCGAIKRFKREGFQWNGLLSLKEQCARRIARIKNEQIKWFIASWLPPDLFQYATKGIFDLHRTEFVLNYPKKLYMWEKKGYPLHVI